MSGVDLATVRELMGHKSIEMTLRYAHLSPDHRKQAVEVLCSQMDTIWTPKEKDKIAEFVNPIKSTFGRVAQLGERCLHTAEVSQVQALSRPGGRSSIG